MPINMREWYKAVAQISQDFNDYYEKASCGVALLAMGSGKVPEGANYSNFIEAWNEARR